MEDDDHDDHDDHQDLSEELQSSQDSSEEPESSLHVNKLNFVPKKKLLVMNLGGFLLHRFIHRQIRLDDGSYAPNPILGSRTADRISRNFLLFKRPFSEEFMKFCLERFEVGIWSSAQEHNIDGALNLAIGEESKHKLLFVWGQSQCSKIAGNSERPPLFTKELSKVWEKVEKGGPYSKSNTLMIDEKPHKAYLNPENTAIFIKSYDPEDKEDNALDPNGDLCEYLKGVADAEDVQSYVKNNAFGIPAIGFTPEQASTFLKNADFSTKFL